MVTKAIMEDYTKYVDTAEMVIEYYKNQVTSGLEKYFLTIENWLQKDTPADENRPLVIQAEEGVGKKTLIGQWIKYHQQKSQKNYPDLIIPHFAGTGGNNANHYYALYKILVRLREHFNIAQKVELLESKLVHYFHYWLDVSNKALIGRIVDDSTVILIFDSINMFIDPDTGEEANISLWLPDNFPYRIKVIVTTEPGSASLRYFENKGCEVITIEDEPKVTATLINNHLARPSYCIDDNYRQKVIEILQKKPQNVTKNSLFLKSYLSTLLPYPSDKLIAEDEVNKTEFAKIFRNMDFKKLEEVNDIDSLCVFLVEYFSKNIMPLDKFQASMAAFTLTEKGLTEKEILDFVKVDLKEWKFLIAVFKTFLMKYKGFWKINNQPFKKAIHQLYLHNNHEYVRRVHEQIAEVLKNTPNSIRKLEEQTYHLNRCHDYFKLKEAISSIENFLLLFNPNNKFELCRYWQILEQKGFDPASEYTKAIEGFELHYRPSPEDTFMIILQVSRFLKEFSDFETATTPDFRHPWIKGGKEIKEIGLRREIKKMGMYLSENWEDDDDKTDDIEELEHELSKEFPDYSEETLRELVNQIYESTKKKRDEDLKKTGFNSSEGAATYRTEGSSPNKKVQKKKDPPILNEVESLNVDIPENRERFKDYYTQKKAKPEDGEEGKTKKIRYLDEDDKQITRHQTEEEEGQTSYSGERRGKRILTDIRRISQADTEEKKTEEVPADFIEFEEEYQPKFYYYKRWLWMMFPWVCLSFKMNYSRIIFECFSSPTKYISVPDEREKTRQALKIAIEAKLKKQSILAKPESPQKTSKLDLASPSKGRKLLPPITHNSSSPNIQKGLEINLTTIRGTDETATISDNNLTVKSDRKKPHQFFITNEFLETSQFNNQTLSLTNRDDPSLPNLSGSLTTRPNHSVIKEKSLFASEKRFEASLQKSSEGIKALLLPKYQDSVLDYSAKNIQELEGKVQKLHITLNDIIFKNKLAAKKLKDLHVIDGNLNQTGAADITEKSQIHADEVNQQIEKAQIVRQETMKAKVRMESILHICLKNKKEDELHIRSLNYLLNSFNKMINLERQSTYEELTKATELEKLAVQFTKAHAEKIETQERMIEHVRNEKQKTRDLGNHVTEVYSNLERSSVEAVDNLKKTAQLNKERQEEKALKLTTARNQTTTNREELEEKRILIEQIETKLGLDFETPKFKEFTDYIEKVSEFEAGIFQVKGDIANLKDELVMDSNHLETLKKARDAPKTERIVHKSAYTAINDKDELQKTLAVKKKKADELSRNIMKNTKLVLDTRMFLTKICGQVGIETEKEQTMTASFPVEKILSSIQEKLKAIEDTMGPEDYEKFKNGKVDMANYITKEEQNKIGQSQIVDFDKTYSNTSVFKHGKKYVEVFPY